MTARLAKLFTDHPASVDETYFGHMAFAAWFASRLFMAASPRSFTLSCRFCSRLRPAGSSANFTSGRTSETDAR